MDGAHHPAGHVGEGPVLRHRLHHQGLLGVVGKPLLGGEAQGDAVPVVEPAAGDVPVEEGTQVYRLGHRHDEAVEQRGFVLRLALVFLRQIGQYVGHVKLHIDVDLRVGALVHQVGHDGVEAVYLPDPAGVPPVPPPLFVLFLHMYELLKPLFIIFCMTTKVIYHVFAGNTIPLSKS